MQALATCQQLTEANLTWCIMLTDAGVVAMVQHCHLQLLSLHGNVHVTNQSINALAASSCSTLHTLDVHGCVGITYTQVDLQRMFPKLTIFVHHT